MLENIHPILIKLRNDLGYKEKEDGLCVHYVEKGIDAFLLGEYHSHFRKRLEYIKENHKQLPAMLKKARRQQALKAMGKQNKLDNDVYSEHELHMIFEVAAFMDQGELYMNPDYYEHVYGRYLRQVDIEKIAYFAEPKALSQIGGRRLVCTLLGMYTLEELTLYVRSLNDLAKRSNNDFVLSLGSSSHRLGLAYSQTKNEWWLIDANAPDFPVVPAEDEYASCLAGLILHCLENKNATIAGFMTHLFTTRKNRKTMLKTLKEWENNEKLLLTHGITVERAKRTTLEGGSLLSMAMRYGCLEVLKLLAALRDEEGNAVVNFGETLKDGDTYAIETVIRGQNEVLKFLLGLITPEGHHVVNCNQANNRGHTPVWFATFCGQTEALKILRGIKTARGEPVIDFNVENRRFNLVEVAAWAGHYDTVKLLLDFGLNKNLGGMTAEDIAFKKGHIEIADLLKNHKVAPSYPLLFKCTRYLLNTLILTGGALMLAGILSQQPVFVMVGVGLLGLASLVSLIFIADALFSKRVGRFPKFNGIFFKELSNKSEETGLMKVPESLDSVTTQSLTYGVG